MTNYIKYICFLICEVAVVPVVFAQVPPPTAVPFTENFSGTSYKDSRSAVAGWPPAPISLTKKSQALQPAKYIFPFGMAVMTIGNFNNANTPDAVVLGYATPRRLFFMEGLGVSGSPPTFEGFSSTLNIIDSLTIIQPEGVVLLTGNFAGDSLPDFMYLQAFSIAGSGALSAAYLYQNTGVSGSIPNFVRSDVYTSSPLAAGNIFWHTTSSNSAQAIDWDNDGYDDLLMTSSIGSRYEVWLFLNQSTGGGFVSGTMLINNAGETNPAVTTTQRPTGGISCPATVTRGINVVMAGDFDLDGDNDIITSSVSNKIFYWFANDGSNSFSLYKTFVYPNNEGGTQVGLVSDFDGDGDKDLVVARDAFNCGTSLNNGSQVYVFLNDITTKNFIPMMIANLGAGSDADYGTSSAITISGQNVGLVVIGDRQDTGAYGSPLPGLYNVINGVPSSTFYNLYGLALSKEIDALDDTQKSIPSVKIDTLNKTLPTANQAVSFYVSNDGGLHWDKLLNTELPPSALTHPFTRYGNDLVFKMELSSNRETLTGTNSAFYEPATPKTPTVTSVGLTFYHVGKYRYSRSAPAFGKVTIGGNTRDLLFNPSFAFPNYEATIRAFDITNFTAGASSTLQRVDNAVGVSLLWDAGELLKVRSGASRLLYGSYISSGTPCFSPTCWDLTKVNSRITMTDSELTAPTTTPSLQTLMQLENTTKSQVFTFIRDGFGGTYKYNDTGHSSPVFVGAPTGDATYLGNQYDTFKSNNASRAPTVYIGGNDGFLHAFAADTGNERFALSPRNLLATLKTQRTVVAGTPTYVHNEFVDGTLVVDDYFDSSANLWKTVLIGGQAKGQGVLDDNYYFALNVTDPTNPLPMWEFSDVWDATSREYSCSYPTTPETMACTDTCSGSTCDSACSLGSTYIESGGKVAIEGEGYTYRGIDTMLNYKWYFSCNINTNPNPSCTDGPSPPGHAGDGVIEAGFLQYPYDWVRYDIMVSTAGSYKLWIRGYNPGGSDRVDVKVNDEIDQIVAISATGDYTTTSTTAFTLEPGEHTIGLWMVDPGIMIDKMILQPAAQTNPFASGTGPVPVCKDKCTLPSCAKSCSYTAYVLPSNNEWPGCGVGNNLKCCPQTNVSGTPGSEFFCAPKASACPLQASTTLGETWSPPAIGKIKVSGFSVVSGFGSETKRWVAFFGSGYNNRNLANVGRSLYAVDIMTGILIGRWDFDDLLVAARNASTIVNAIPGGPALVDINGDGFVDRLYFGDLEGRLWRINTNGDGVRDGTTGLISSGSWPKCLLFDAGDPNQDDALRLWAPIVTKPAIALIDANNPNIYFGTGGDPSAPSNVTYRFYSVRDTASTSCNTGASRAIDLAAQAAVEGIDYGEGEWIIGDGMTNELSPKTFAAAGLSLDYEGVAGERYWTNPIIVNGNTIVFSQMPGDIEGINPYFTGSDKARIYVYAVKDFTDDGGTLHTAGKSVLTTGWLQLQSRFRSTVATLRGEQPAAVVRPDTAGGAKPKVDILFQEFSSANANEQPANYTITVPGLSTRTTHKILRWREIPLQ